MPRFAQGVIPQFAVDQVPADARQYLTSARQAGRQADSAGAARLMLTHLFPGTDHAVAREAAGGEYDGEIGVAVGGLSTEI